MSFDRDEITKQLNRALSVILVRYPTRTALGVIVGFVLNFITILFGPALSEIKFMDFRTFSWMGWESVGVLLMHAPTVRHLYKQKAVGHDDIDRAIDVIENGNFTAAERRQMYRALVEKVISALALSGKTKKRAVILEKAIGDRIPGPERKG